VTEELYERAVDLLKRVADEFERLAGVELEVPLPEELAKAWLDSKAYTAALQELFKEKQKSAITRDELVESFREHRKLTEPFEVRDAVVPNVLTVKLYERTGTEYPAGEEPWPNDELIEAVGQLEEEVRRDRLLSS
jgi:hypothetical protein